MARKYTYMDGKYIGWGMTECEERVLIPYFHQIEGRIRPGSRWPEDFRSRFYQGGEGVSDRNLHFVNLERRRLRLDLFTVKETAGDDYAKNTDRSWKAKIRQEILDEYLSLDTAGQTKWVTDATDDMARLPPPLYPFVGHVEPTNGLSLVERDTRREAVRVATPPKPDFTRTIRLLALASRAETVDLILRALTPDEALLLAECGKLDNPDLIDRLVVRSLEHQSA
jgi:hypothetical protein